jgi:hypothetical protein
LLLNGHDNLSSSRRKIEPTANKNMTKRTAQVKISREISAQCGAILYAQSAKSG